MRRATRSLSAVGVVAVVAGLLLLASPAFAARGYDTQIPVGFPTAVTVDSSNNLWVVNGEGVSEYAPQSSNLLGTQSGGGVFGEGAFQGAGTFYDRSLALDNSNGSLYVSELVEGRVDVFENDTGPLTEQWKGFGNPNALSVAVDNSGGPSNGRVYVAYSPSSVQVFEPNHTKVDFSASEPYINGNQINRTPNGSFGYVAKVAVDNHGNFYLADQEKNEVDEFKSTGEFVQAFKGHFSGPTSVAVDPTNGNVLVLDENYGVDEFTSSGEFVGQINGSETPAGSLGPSQYTYNVLGGIAVDSEGYLYVADGAHGVVDVFTPNVPLPKITYETPADLTQHTATVSASIDPEGSGEIIGCYFEYGTSNSYGSPHIPCSPETPYSGTGLTKVSANVSGLLTETTYHYRVVVTDESGFVRRGGDETFTLHAVAGLVTEPATDLEPTSAVLNGAFLGNGEHTHYYFEWGPTSSYGHKTVPPQDAGSPVGPTKVSFTLAGLEPATTYHFRIVAENGAGTTSGGDQEFTSPPAPPVVTSEQVSAVHADTALVHAQINPGGGDTTYYVAYGTDSGYGSLAPVLPADAGSGRSLTSVSVLLSALKPDTTYHYQFVAENARETTKGHDRTFTTLPFGFHETCPNSHVRQQAGAAQLLDCRAYELVSAANTAGYDVESNLVPGQAPFAGYPQADGRVLYGIHDGAIPGIGNPTNRGVDPYLATRGANGWTTEYVGIPSNATPSTAPFASTLDEVDSGLETFVFAGPEICSPCFADGSTGVPLRLPSAQLVQGMAGPLDPGSVAEPAGFVAKPLSADGTHFVFGSKSQFAADGNQGEISIYDRSLKSGETHVVSTTPTEQTMKEEGTEIGELDISNDGSRIMIGHLVEEVQGAKYWHLYMNIGDSAKTIDLTPGTTHGVLFDGMTADGSKVFFSTVDHLTGKESAHSGADIFEAEISGAGTATLHLISKGQEEEPGKPGDTASCHPSANTKHEHWNTTGEEENCGVVAVGGGGGVASSSGTIYFLSPEKLDGSSNGVQNAPNLYLSRPGQPSHFVATLQSSLSAPLPPKTVHPFLGSFGSFKKPTAAAITEAPGEEGDFYVLDDVGQTLQKFDPEGNLVAGFGEQGKLEAPFSKGAGTLTSGSTTIELVTGNFFEGETIAGTGIPAETTIEAVNPGSLRISRPATFSGPVSLRAIGSPLSNYGHGGTPQGIAVDNDPSSPSYRDIYVPDSYVPSTGKSVVLKLSPSGELISQIDTNRDAYSGVSVDQANGDLYLPRYQSQEIEVFDPEGNLLTSFATSFHPAAAAVSADGTVYVVGGGGLRSELNGTVAYEPSSTSPLEYTKPPQPFDSNPSFGAAVTPEGSIYIDEGTQVSEFDPSGHLLGTPFGVGILKEHFVEQGGAASLGLAAGSDSLIVSNPGAGPGNEHGSVAAFGSEFAPDPQTDNPLVVDSVSAPEARHTADFQITPSGSDAAFSSTLALAGKEEETDGHTEVYRYNTQSESIDCVSCTLTGAPSAGDASLASNGLSLTDEGRVFFNTTDQLAAGDTDHKQDVYEWEPQGTGNCEESSLTFSRTAAGCLALISAGTSAFDSDLLGVDASGKDAYFFTYDSLVPQDKSGSAVKIYDAREGGGFPYEFPPPLCKASDECHGASSPAPPPLQVGSESGTSHQYEPGPKECRKGFVLKHGKCVKKPKHHKHHKRSNHKRGGKK